MPGLRCRLWLGQEMQGSFVQASQGFVVVPDDQEEKLKLPRGDISEKVPKGA